MQASADSRPLHAIGLMSGTSLDGIDAALVVTDGERIAERGPSVTFAYPENFRSRLRALLGRMPEPSWEPVIDELTDRHADAVLELLDAAHIAAETIDVVGFHGQTVLHRPNRRRTVQIGDSQRLADRLGIPVVADFRQADVAAGGQGAPLVPLYHAALAEPLEKPLVVLNIGGVANLTWIGSDTDEPPLLAFDTGPGNALIDDFVRTRTGAACDKGGRLAAAGHSDGARVMAWLRHDFFVAPGPKSLDRNEFAFAAEAVASVSDTDGAATLSAFTARAIILALPLLPAPPRRILVCGGGRHNPVLLQMIADGSGVPVEPVETVGWRGDSIEAEAFAFLAVRSLRGLPLTLPATTGVLSPLTGGSLYRPASRVP
ncbi:MAG: anhydro-N-acetylmuramic acid kinase [Defluviicoccus sp.]|nr:MAG: anhydro-N-acetylmuramic acid kinase [Defluviicoccus sp.]